jgi:hypothetical protein
MKNHVIRELVAVCSREISSYENSVPLHTMKQRNVRQYTPYRLMRNAEGKIVHIPFIRENHFCSFSNQPRYDANCNIRINHYIHIASVISRLHQ